MNHGPFCSCGVCRRMGADDPRDRGERPLSEAYDELLNDYNTLRSENEDLKAQLAAAIERGQSTLSVAAFDTLTAQKNEWMDKYRDLSDDVGLTRYTTLLSAARRVVFADREQFEDPSDDADQEIEESMQALAAACGIKPLEE